jgi:diacylglycerol kinase (ATP)
MYLFLINPVSGNGTSLKVWKIVQQELERQGVAYRHAFTERAGHAADLARIAADEHRSGRQPLIAVVAIGGDGTIHEVVNGLADCPELPVGVIPAGSGNDFVRGFDLPKQPLAALEHLLAAGGLRVRTVDVGRYRLGAGREGLFINGIGIGFDGEIAKRANESRFKPLLNRLRLGQLAYVLTMFRLLFTYRTHDVEIVIDGEARPFSNVWLIAVSNIAFYGGGMRINPQAVPDDGEFNLCIVHNLSRLKLLAVFSTVFPGKHTRFEEVTMLRGRQIEVRSSRPMTIHADGEIIGTTPLTVEVEAGARAVV